MNFHESMKKQFMGWAREEIAYLRKCRRDNCYLSSETAAYFLNQALKYTDWAREEARLAKEEMA